MNGRRSIDSIFRCVIMGPPGAGKGTISERILRNFPLMHISCGDHIRAHIHRKTAFGQQAVNYISKGQLLPDALVSKIMVDEIQHHSGENWLLDGFPRTIAQAELLQSLDPADAVIDLDVPLDVIVQRLAHRWIHAPSGRIYNLEFNPPKVQGKDDVTGEPLTQRLDDKPETVRQRLLNFKEWEQPVADFFSGLGILHRFSGTKSDEIWPHVQLYMAEQLPSRTQIPIDMAVPSTT